MRKMLSKKLEILLKRPFIIDSRVPTSYIICCMLVSFVNLLRGLVFVRAKILLGKGSRIVGRPMLHLQGGLVRIENNCLIDCLGTEGVHLGRNFKLSANSRLISSGTIQGIGIGIRIGDNVGIGEFSYIGGAGGVTIGADTIIGQYFSVHSENHVIDDPDLPIRKQGVTRKGVFIGSGCWIGSKVTICDGVKIGNNCVIAAGCVVTKSFPDHSVISGVPARLVRTIYHTAKKDKN